MINDYNSFYPSDEPTPSPSPSRSNQDSDDMDEAALQQLIMDSDDESPPPPRNEPTAAPVSPRVSGRRQISTGLVASLPVSPRDAISDIGARSPPSSVIDKQCGTPSDDLNFSDGEVLHNLNPASELCVGFLCTYL